ncbi:unnamed protein product [Moneuplotes crassus]|uniref:Uncharacterized protein n=1 Tax=Euplotes crassus TaxID=5936 RepID=A0AAD1UD74_EUPCR|nr:unnamed protein product [Moneuplotes crassus]
MESSSSQLSSQIPATPEAYSSEMQKVKDLQYALNYSKRTLVRYLDHGPLKFPARITQIQKAFMAIKEEVSMLRYRESNDVGWRNFIYQDQSISWSLDIILKSADYLLNKYKDLFDENIEQLRKMEHHAEISHKDLLSKDEIPSVHGEPSSLDADKSYNQTDSLVCTPQANS